MVQMVASGKRVPGFIVEPAAGVLEVQTGISHFPTDRLMVLKATKPGMATIAFRGPIARESSQDGCDKCWSGYVHVL